MPEPARGDGQDQILGRRHLGIAFLWQCHIRGFFFIFHFSFVCQSSNSTPHFQIGGAFFRCRFEVPDNRHRDHAVVLAEPDAAHAC